MLKEEIKSKIKDLAILKVRNRSHFCKKIGYSGNFLSGIINRKHKFFNLDQIERICKGLDYPVYLLFMDDTIMDPRLVEISERLKKLSDNKKKKLIDLFNGSGSV